jgi:REP element-mobilizing transposase RayT
MGHTFASHIYHIVVSTKERRRFLSTELNERLAPFVGGIIRERDGKLLAMNGADDHVHLLAILPPKTAVSEQVRDIKAISSGWIGGNFADLRLFQWQGGYSSFTVGVDSLPRVKKYIAGQREHHRTQTFEEELIAMLKRAGIEYDIRYLLD